MFQRLATGGGKEYPHQGMRQHTTSDFAGVITTEYVCVEGLEDAEEFCGAAYLFKHQEEEQSSMVFSALCTSLVVVSERRSCPC